jgi:hypothetical protein
MSSPAKVMAKVMAAGIEQTLKKVNEGFISMIAENYGIDPAELEEMLATVIKEVAKDEGKQIRKSKKTKTPRKTSAYQVFMKERYSEVKEANKGLTFGKISKLIGEMWRSLDEEEKAEYEAKAKIVNGKEKTNKNEKKTKEKKNKKTKKQKKQKKTSSDEESSSSDVSSSDISSSEDETEKKTCVALLQSGKRQGLECGAKVGEGSEFCKRHNKPKAKKPKKKTKAKKNKKTKKNEKKEEEDEMTMTMTMTIPEDEIPSEEEDDSSYEDEINELEIAEESDNEDPQEEKHVQFSDEDEVRIIEEDSATEYVGTGMMRRPKPRDATVRHSGKNRSVDRLRDRWD